MDLCSTIGSPTSSTTSLTTKPSVFIQLAPCHSLKVKRAPIISCHFCDKLFKRKEGLTQHLHSGSFCSARQQNDEEAKRQKIVNKKSTTKPEAALFTDLISAAHSQSLKRSRMACKAAASNAAVMEDVMAWEELQEGRTVDKGLHNAHKSLLVTDRNIQETDDVADGINEAVDDDTDNSAQFVDLSETDVEILGTIAPKTDTICQQQFQKHCDSANHFLPFAAQEVSAIRLLDTLRGKKCSLDTCDSIPQWHFQTTGQLQKGGALGNCMNCLSRCVLLPKLMKRCNLQTLEPTEEPIRLPSSNSKANVVVHDAIAAVQSPLTDPRHKDEDHMFHNDDPFASPPDDLDCVADLNTGTAHVESHKSFSLDPETCCFCS